MMRNDYRRALILLRGNAPGYSGHVRLERRTLMGSMYFLLQAPAECPVLRAALVGRDKNGYFACTLGEMNRDGRGQAVLTWNFDPRNICGRELEQYRLIAVTCAGDADCRVVLYGNVSGHADLNWERVRSALCNLYSDGAALEEQAPAADLPEADGGPDAAPANAPAQVEDPTVLERIQEGLRREIQEEIREEQEDLREDIREFFNRDAPEFIEDILDIDLEQPWPESIEPLRPVFKVSVPMQNPPDEEYTYIAAAMPEGSGYSHCAVGVLAQEGMPVSVRYGLPAAWTAEPPAGLEEYSWVGDSNRGWWMTQVDLYNGRCL